MQTFIKSSNVKIATYAMGCVHDISPSLLHTERPGEEHVLGASRGTQLSATRLNTLHCCHQTQALPSYGVVSSLWVSAGTSVKMASSPSEKTQCTAQRRTRHAHGRPVRGRGGGECPPPPAWPP